MLTPLLLLAAYAAVSQTAPQLLANTPPMAKGLLLHVAAIILLYALIRRSPPSATVPMVVVEAALAASSVGLGYLPPLIAMTYFVLATAFHAHHRRQAQRLRGIKLTPTGASRKKWVKWAEVIHVDAGSQPVKVLSNDGRGHAACSLTQLHANLPQDFVQIDSRQWINPLAIDDVTQTTAGDMHVRLHEQTTLPVTSRFQRSVLQHRQRGPATAVR
ncbi:MAG: hypothetical protein Tsb002_02480 [Wenzhouxiangellaceae bacterium]